MCRGHIKLYLYRDEAVSSSSIFNMVIKRYAKDWYLALRKHLKLRKQRPEIVSAQGNN